MRYYYGEKNILRALDEAEFWKTQEADHTDLIPAVTPNLEAQYAQRLHQLGLEIRQNQAEAVKYITSITRSNGMISQELKMQMLNLIKACVEQSKNFVSLMNEMLSHSHAVNSNPTSQSVLHHMIRESQYFIGIDQLILSTP